jgi:hypothetical protein
VINAQRLTSKAHMSDPRWRDTRPSRPYGGEPESRTPRRDPRGSDARQRGGPGDGDTTRRMPAQTGPTQPVAPPPIASPPVAAPRDGTSGRAANDTGRGREADRRPPGPGGRLSRIWHGSLGGGLAVCVIVGSAVIGAIATIVTRAQPGSVLGLSVLAGTVAAALTVQPRAGRLIFPVPALSYLIAALVSGVVYDRASNKTELAVGAAQWIASGFFVMVMATLLAIALTTVRWFMWRRDQRGPVPPQYGGFADGRDPRGSGGYPRPPETQPSRQGPPGSQGTRGWDRRPGPRPGSGPYNFSSGA